MLMTIVVKLMTTRNYNNKRDNRAGTNINKSGSIQNRKSGIFLMATAGQRMMKPDGEAPKEELT